MSPERVFEFGRNWRLFLEELDDARIASATSSLSGMLGLPRLDGKSFLDIGAGSGLFSLAARRLGARVVSFDADPESVACEEELKRRFFKDDGLWLVQKGSALDEAYLASLGTFDVVYSWGVLHHTGDLWRALELVCGRVAPGGKLFIAIYNDQGWASSAWRFVKRLYNVSPRGLRPLILGLCFLRLWGPTLIKDALKGRPLATWRGYGAAGRGMSPWRDVVDWVGGYPFETARPEAIVEFYKGRGFVLERLTSVGRGHGCNEFVFRRG